MTPIKKLYPRKCESCGEGMHEGYYMESDGVYLCGISCLSSYLYDQGVCYYSEWNEDDVLEGEPMYRANGEEVYLEEV